MRTPSPTVDAVAVDAVAVDAVAVLERAKGALMLRYGTDAERAGAILVSWSRQRQLAPATVANLLLAAICEGSSVRQEERELVRWLEDRLRRMPDDGIAPGG